MLTARRAAAIAARCYLWAGPGGGRTASIATTCYTGRAGRLEEPAAVGVGGGLDAVPDAELGEDVVGVADDGVHAQHELTGDLGVALSLREQPQHLDLPLGEAVRARR